MKKRKRRVKHLIASVTSVMLAFLMLFLGEITETMAGTYATYGYEIANWNQYGKGSVPGANEQQDLYDSSNRGICSCYNIKINDDGTSTRTSYGDWGYSVLLKVGETSMWMGRSSNIMNSDGSKTSGGDALSQEVSGVQYDGTSFNQITDASGNTFTQVILNITNTNNYATTFSVATTCDLQVGTDDNAYCQSICGSDGNVVGFTTSNSKYTGSNALWGSEQAYSINVYARNTPGVTDADCVCVSAWTSQYYNAFTNNILGNTDFKINTKQHSNVTGTTGFTDTGFSIGWTDRTIQAGETITLSYILGVTEYDDNYTQTNNYYKKNSNGDYELFYTTTDTASYGDTYTASNVSAPDGTYYSYATDNLGTTVNSSSLSYTVTGNATNNFYYDSCDQFIRYHSNDDTGQCTRGSYYVLSENKVSYNGFVRSGFSFTTWNTESDGTGTSYNEDDVMTSTSGQAKILSAVNENYTLDIAGGSQDSGANAWLWNSFDTEAQEFAFVYRGEENGTPYWEIVNTKSGKCLDVEGGTAANATNVQTWTYAGTDNQLWTLLPTDDGYWIIKSKLGNYYLDLSGCNDYDGSNIQIWEWTGGDGQKWKIDDITMDLYAQWIDASGPDISIAGPDTSLTGTDWVNTDFTSIATATDSQTGIIDTSITESSEYVIPDGEYVIAAHDNRNYVLNVVCGYTDNGTNVELYQYLGSEQEKWEISYVGDGYYKVINVNSGKALNNTAESSNVQQWEFSDDDQCLWYIVLNSDGTYSFCSKADGLYLDISGNNVNNATNVQTWEENGSNAQKFRLIPVSEYYNDGDTSMQSSITISDEGIHTVLASAINSDGLTSYTTATVKIDKTAPEIYDVEDSYTATNDTITIDPYGTDALSGMKYLKLYDSNGNLLASGTDDLEFTFSGRQDTLYKIVAQDVAGNVSDTKTFSVNISTDSNIVVNHYVMLTDGTYSNDPDVTQSLVIDANQQIVLSDLADQDLIVANAIEYAFGNVDGTSCLTYTPSGSCTINLYYNRVSYNVYYDVSTYGGTWMDNTNAIAATKVYYGADVDLSKTAQKGTWKFMGWNTSDNATNGLSSLTMSTEDIYLYAIFNNSITVTFIDCKGSQTIIGDIYNNDDYITITAPDINSYSDWSDVADIETVGWNDTEDINQDGSTDQQLSAGQTIKIYADKTYYAVYAANVTLQYDLNGGISTDATDPVTKTVYVNASDLTTILGFKMQLADAATHDNVLGEGYIDNYDMVAWAENSVDGTNYDAGADYTLTANTTMYALWQGDTEPIQYTIRFDANGGTGSMPDIVATYDQEIILPGNVYTRSTDSGTSTFLGWSVNASSYDPEYLDQDVITNLTNVDNEVVILYAIWDDCPILTAVDQYYTLQSAQNGEITKDKLLESATAEDDRDDDIQEKIDVKYYDAEEWKQFTSDAESLVTYVVTDSSNNKTQVTVTVHLVDTTAEEIEDTSYVRSISPDYYLNDPEDGGLEENSVWRNDPEYAAVLQSAMENIESMTYEQVSQSYLGNTYTATKAGSVSRDHTYQTWVFTSEQIKQIKEYVNNNGLGNISSSNGLSGFLSAFSSCKQ